MKIVALTLAMAGAAWSSFLLIFGGVDTEILGQRVSTNDWLKPLLIASFALSVFILAGGAVRSADRVMATIRAIDDRLIAGLLALAVTITGVVYCTSAASGADAYGYVSQAELWLKGKLVIDQPFEADMPFPSRRWAFAPLGYRPVEQDGAWAIVPTYSPGLPMLMALAKLIGGHCALFAVVPLSGGLLVLVTYGLGRRLVSSRAGLIAAFLVATSPVFLFMLMWPMTDVPVAAAWATAFYFLLNPSRRSIVASGIAATLGTLIRPNLAFGVGIGIWYLIRGGPWRKRLADFAVFLVAAAPGILIAGAINNHLYGSPFISGYAGMGGLFDTSHVGANLRNYFSWLIETQSFIPLIGFAALFVPLRAIWQGRADRRVLWVIAGFVVLLWAQYMVYLVFDIWWYLRFLLASWPFIMIGVAAVTVALMDRRQPLLTTAVVLVVAGLGVFQFKYAATVSAFDLWEGERRYVTAGRLVRSLTDERSVIFSMQHSGSVRYYSGRMSIRFDNIDDDWLDRAVTFFAERGITSYLLAEEWEEPDFRKRFAKQQTVAQLDLPPLFKYDGPAKIALYDLTHARPREASVMFVTETFKDTYCVPPAPPPTLDLRGR